MEQIVELETSPDPSKDPGKNLEEVRKVLRECEEQIHQLEGRLASPAVSMAERVKLETELAGYRYAEEKALLDEKKYEALAKAQGN